MALNLIQQLQEVVFSSLPPPAFQDRHLGSGNIQCLVGLVSYGSTVINSSSCHQAITNSACRVSLGAVSSKAALLWSQG